MTALTRLLLSTSISTLLIACGGGGGGSDTADVGAQASNVSSSSISTTSSSTSTFNGETTLSTESTQQSSSQTQVVSASGHSLTFQWDIPTTRANGSPLQFSEIYGYEIVYFQENNPADSGEKITIEDPNTTQYTTPKLAPGTYHIAIATIDDQSVPGDLSDTVTTTIP